MFKSKDGKSFGSAYVAKKRDAMHGEGDKTTNAPESPMASKEESRTNNEGEALFSKSEANAPDNNVKSNPENVDPHSVVAEHGPASDVHIHSDMKANEHHVMSHHKSGHVHHSKHGSAQDAHKAAAELAEAGDQPSGNPEEGNAPESDGFTMPRLA
jgi:hypothetical protein